ncbi:hypothetical protein ABOM_011127, partial [Aspergillus bombycis]
FEKMTSETKFLPSVLITGCSAGGIGSALAEAFHERGLYVFATARSLDKMAHLEKLPNVTLLELDVTCDESIKATVATVAVQAGGKLNYLVNNSGQCIVMPALETSIDKAKELFDVNLWGVIAVTHAFAPLLIAAKGTIVNIASIAAFAHSPWLSIYSASKSALDTYSHTLRLELAPFGVEVVTVTAGTVKTNIYRGFQDSPLPEHSMYKAAATEITELANGGLVAAAMLPSTFARKVVGDLLRGASGTIWRGTFATSVWILSFMPAWLVVCLSPT